MREIALDTETTGLSPQTGHRMVEIGCVEMQGRVRTGNVLHFYLNPQRDVPAEAQRVHGLSAEFLADKPLFAEIADKFLNFIADSPLVIHNAPFDMAFLNAELQKAGCAPLPMERVVDTLPMARERFPGSPASLDALCRRFEVDLSGRNFHGALLDAELLADVYLELMGGRQSALSLETLTAQMAAILPGEVRPGSNFPPRQFAPSSEELAAHEAFVDSALKNPLWKAAG